MATKKSAKPVEDAKLEAVSAVEETVSKPEDKVAAPTKTAVRKANKIDPDDYVTVRSNVMGILTYISSRQMGYNVTWEQFGDEEEIKFGELQAMRNSQRRFFVDNWVYIDDPEVLKALGVEKYYTNAVNADNVDLLFAAAPEHIEKRVSAMSGSMKDTVKRLALEKYHSGELDSIKKIRALERALDFKFEED